MAKIGFDINNFVAGSNKDLTIPTHTVDITEEVVPVKRKRRSTKSSTPAVVEQQPPQTSMSYIQENIPYMTAYSETNQQLDEAIMQLNALGGEIMSELASVKSSKTLRNKYNHITEMTNTATSIINAKIAAIKEKNKSINDVNNLEIRRLKELTISNQEDDNTRIANLYDAFINTPVGVGSGPNVLGPSMQDMMLMGNANSNLDKVSLGTDQGVWEQNLDPANNRMLLEAKGVIETVVMYDDVSGNRWFEVVDKVTRQPVPNVEKPDNSYIYDLDINIRGGFAKDPNRKETYPLIVIHNGDTSITDY